jgi:hypothetical protein
MVGHHDEELESLYFDMMPFTDNSISFNTGVFSSRPNLKTAIREGSRVLHSANKLYITKILGHGGRSHDPGTAYLKSSQMLSEIIASA